MNMKLAGGILAVGLAALASYADGDEPEVPARYTATVVPGGTKSYTNAEHWSPSGVPNGYHVDVRIDGDSSVASTLSFASGESKLTATNGVVNIDSGDTLSISTSYNNTGANMSLWTSCITNNGTITFGNVKKNNGDYYIHAYDSARDENYPSRNGRDGVININSMNAAGCDHYLYWLLDGSVNDGEITISAVGAQYQYAVLLNLLGRDKENITVSQDWLAENEGKSITMDYWIHNGLGASYARLGDNAKAIASLEKAVQSSST